MSLAVLGVVDQSPSDMERCVQEFNRERSCESFVGWQQGSTPKEHMEMKDREEERKWRSRQDWKLIVVAGIFTIVGGLLGHWH